MSRPNDPASAAMGQWTHAVLAAEVTALSMLKAEMEGLALLFGGAGHRRTEAELRAEDAAEEAALDNLPV